MRQVYGVFFGDGIGKGILAVTTIYLISVMDINSYAYFTLIFTSIMMGYQTVSGVVERLYIVEFEEFSPVATEVMLIIGSSLACLFFVYLVVSTDFTAGFLCLLGIGTFVFYQYQRIKLQKKELFSIFIAMDLIKNSIWLFLSIFVIWIKVENLVEWVVISMVLAVVPPIFPSYRREYKEISVGPTGSEWEFGRALAYIRSKKMIVVYAIVAGFLPYLPIVLADLDGENHLIATYGAALRYQAILALAVYAANVVFLPKISKCDGRQAIDMVKRFYTSLPLAILLLFIFCVFSVFSIPYLDGNKYENLQISFLILALCSVFTLISTPMVNILISNQKYTEMLIILVLGVFCILISWPVFILISKPYGILLSNLFGYFVINALFFFHGARVVFR